MTDIIAAHLTPDLLNPEHRRRWKSYRSHTWGLCYYAAEALWHLTGNVADPKKIRSKEFTAASGFNTHWFLWFDNTPYDPSRQQFCYNFSPNYYSGKGCGFLTKEPSKPAREIIRRVILTLTGKDTSAKIPLGRLPYAKRKKLPTEAVIAHSKLAAH